MKHTSQEQNRIKHTKNKKIKILYCTKLTCSSSRVTKSNELKRKGTDRKREERRKKYKKNTQFKLRKNKQISFSYCVFIDRDRATVRS